MFALGSLPCLQGRVGVGWGQALASGLLKSHPLPTSPCKQGEEPFAGTVNRRRGRDVSEDLLHITMSTLRTTAGPADGKRDGRSPDKTTVKRLP
jgi:hypothetical protein